MQFTMRYFSAGDSAGAGGADLTEGIIVPPRKQTTPTMTRTISLLFMSPSFYFLAVACDVTAERLPKGFSPSGSVHPAAGECNRRGPWCRWWTDTWRIHVCHCDEKDAPRS